MLQRAVDVARRRLAASREVKLIAGRSPAMVFSAVDAAVRVYRDDLVKLGVVDKYTGEVDYARLAKVVKSRKWEKRDEFLREVGRRLGVRTDEKLAGKIAVLKVARARLAAERVAGAGSLAALSSIQVAKLNELGNQLAQRFGDGSYAAFAKKYASDEKFREKVNNYIQSVLEKNPDLAALRGNSPDRVVGLVTAVKAASMSRLDLARDTLRSAVKDAAMKLAANTIMATAAFGTAALMQVTGLIMTANPQMSQTMYMSFYTMQNMAASANKFLSQMYVFNTMENMRRMQEAQGARQ